MKGSNDQPKKTINPNVRQCPACGAEGYVVDSRLREDGTIVRRRKCRFCGQLWHTKEIPLRERKPVSDMLLDAGFE